MKENEIIAEYIKKRHPEILNTIDYQSFRLSRQFSDFGNELAKSIREASSGIVAAVSSIDWKSVGEQLEECKSCEYFDKATYECSYDSGMCKNESIGGGTNGKGEILPNTSTDTEDE